MAMIITAPLPYQIVQRGNDNEALVLIAGRTDAQNRRLFYEFTPVWNGQRETGQLAVADGVFSAYVPVQGGLYSLQLTTDTGESAGVVRVGVGEVFAVVGHSVAQGDDRFTLEGGNADRVFTSPIDLAGDNINYRDSGKLSDWPPAFSPYLSGVKAGPFGSNTHLWAKMGEAIAEKAGVPVLIYNAAFGGTTLDYWAKSATGGSFNHSFIKSEKSFPYVNLRNALSRAKTTTGLRAVLCDLGQNDYEVHDEAKLIRAYQQIIATSRTEVGFEGLAWVINRQTPFRSEAHIRRVQEAVIAGGTNIWSGPDYDKIDYSTDSPDTVHLNEKGLAKAAEAWAVAIGLDHGLFATSTPLLAGVKPGVAIQPPAQLIQNTTEIDDDQIWAIGFNASFVMGALCMALGIFFIWLVIALFRDPEEGQYFPDPDADQFGAID